MDKRIPANSWIHNAFQLWLRLPYETGRKPKHDMAYAYQILKNGKSKKEIAEIFGISHSCVCTMFSDCEKIRKKITANSTANTVSGT